MYQQIFWPQELKIIPASICLAQLKLLPYLGEIDLV
jgi:hypothetical protein